METRGAASRSNEHLSPYGARDRATWHCTKPHPDSRLLSLHWPSSSSLLPPAAPRCQPDSADYEPTSPNGQPHGRTARSSQPTSRSHLAPSTARTSSTAAAGPAHAGAAATSSTPVSLRPRPISGVGGPGPGTRRARTAAAARGDRTGERASPPAARETSAAGEERHPRAEQLAGDEDAVVEPLRRVRAIDQTTEANFARTGFVRGRGQRKMMPPYCHPAAHHLLLF